MVLGFLWNHEGTSSRCLWPLGAFQDSGNVEPWGKVSVLIALQTRARGRRGSQGFVAETVRLKFHCGVNNGAPFSREGNN